VPGSEPDPRRDLARETQDEIARHAEARRRWPGVTLQIDDAGGRYFFDEVEARRAVDFFHEELVLVSSGYRPFVLLDWQAQLVIRPLFGWKFTEKGCGCTDCGGVQEKQCQAGTRRFRKLYLEVAKKNGKSPLVAGIGVYLLQCDGEPAAEVYAVASEKEQARIVFNEARDMHLASADLRERTDVLKNALYVPSTGSSFKVLSPVVKSKHGPRVHGLLFDEFHAQESRELYEALHRGTSSRSQPLVVLATTAGTNLETICYEEHERAVRAIEDSQLAAGERREMDETVLAVIFAAEETDDWTSLETWRKANPSLGVTKRLDYMEAEARAAQAEPRKLAAFKQLDLNIWGQSHRAWLDVLRWDGCKDMSLRIPRDEKGFLRSPDDRVIVPAGFDATAGLDLASKLDLVAFVVEVRRPDRARPPTALELLRRDASGQEIRRPFAIDFGIDVFPWFWIPEVTMHAREKEDRVPYSTWLRHGNLRVTPGEVCDYNAIYSEIVGEILPFFKRAGSPVREVGFDPANATQFTNTLAADGVRCVEVPQTVVHMSDPAKLFEALVKDRRVRHDGHPVLRWNVGNVAAKPDKKENIFPYKPKDKLRIDGAIAGIIALARMMYLEPAPPAPFAFLT